MLDFDHVPPRGPEDVKFSEAGEFILRDRHSHANSMEACGRLALTQIISAFELPLNNEDRGTIAEIQYHVYDLADKLLEDLSTTEVNRSSVLGPYIKGSASIKPFVEGLGFERALGRRTDRQYVWSLITLLQAKTAEGAAA